MAQIDSQIQLFLEMTKLPEQSVVSVAVDAMAMNADRSYLPSKKSDSVFVIFVQTLDRRYRCLPLHVMRHESGQVTPDVQAALSEVCEALLRHQVVVKYKCADGNKGYNEAHRKIFNDWCPLLETGGLGAALRFVSQSAKVPIRDFLHLCKNYCNKAKNHPVVLSPDSFANVVTCDDLQTVLRLGRVLTDKSSTAKMRDSYALNLFSLTNCSKCIEAKNLMAVMYLLPWPLQEEVLRSRRLARQERLEKAILACNLLFHYYRLSHFPHPPGISQRFHSKTMVAVTFAGLAANFEHCHRFDPVQT
jgi:hypothetical protein